MVNHLPSSAGVSENKESTQVDIVGAELDRIFGPNPEPNGTFWYTRGDPNTKENGGYAFSQIMQSEAYKAFADKEMNVYKDNDQLQAIIQTHFGRGIRNIIDMGPGDGEKSAPFLEEVFGRSLNGKTYIPVDVSPWFVQHSSSYVKRYLDQEGVHVKTAGINMNFLESDAALKDIKDKMYLFLGGSIGNFSDEEIIQILKHMSSEKTFGDRSPLVFSYFTAPNPDDEYYHDNIQKLLATYGDPNRQNPYYNKPTHDAIEKRIMGGFAALGLDTSKLEFHVTYDEAHTRMILGAKVKETITIKHNGKIYTKEAGDVLRAIQSKRFTEEKMKEITDKAGAKLWLPFKGDGIAISLMETDRSPESKKNMKKAKKGVIATAVATALLAAGGYGGIQLDKKFTREKVKKTFVTDMAPWANQSNMYRGFGGLQSNGKASAEADWNSYEYRKNYITCVYGVSKDKVDDVAFQDAFLRWKVKQIANGKYSEPTPYGGGEIHIHLINDFVAERGDEYGISTKDYFGFLRNEGAAIYNTLHAPDSLRTSDGYLTQQKTIATNIYLDLFDEERATIGKVGKVYLNGKEYIVSAYMHGNNEFDTFSIAGGKDLLRLYYLNTPGLFSFSKTITKRYKISEDNVTYMSLDGSEFNESTQRHIQHMIADLLAQGYSFDFYQMNTASNNFQLDYFVNTFLQLPDSAYKNANILNRDYFHSTNIHPLLDSCIDLIKKENIAKRELSPYEINHLKSTIFYRIYINSARTARDLIAKNVVEDLREVIEQEVIIPKAVIAPGINANTLRNRGSLGNSGHGR